MPEQKNKNILDEVRKVTYKDIVTILKEIDQDLLKGAIGGDKFKKYFFDNCKCEKIKAVITNALEK